MLEFIEIKNIATFDGAGVEIADLQKVNFIYGGNGTGKTTIANYLENPDHPDYSTCKLNWKNNDKMETLVYNENFKRKNFGQDNLQGIFTLGEASIELHETLERKETILKTLMGEGKELRNKLNKAKESVQSTENGFRESVWQGIRKTYLPDFKEALRGGWTKIKFVELLLQKFESRTGETNSLEDLKERAAILFSDRTTPLDLIPITPFDEVFKIEEHPLWRKVIVGKEDIDFSRLIQKLNISDWVHQGTEYIRKETCPFCQQDTLTEEVRSQIEEFFDESYLNDVRSIRELSQNYRTATQHIIDQLNEIEDNHKGGSGSKLDIDSFTHHSRTLINQISRNIELMDRKVREPSRVVELISLNEIIQSLTTLVQEANAQIQNHNHIVNNIQTERYLLIQSIWEYILEENSHEIQSYLDSKSGLEEEVKVLSQQIKEKGEEFRKLNQEIMNLHRQKGGFQPAIDEINKMLEKFKFLNFRIVPAAEEGFYQIRRHDGSDAKPTLSEGEKSLISFLYFLQLTKGGFSEEELRNDRTLVIDDPTSHMDDRLINIVSALLGETVATIKRDMDPVKQLILLTHDRYFFKKISSPDASDSSSSDDTHYWILRKEGKSTRIDVYQKKNPLAIFN